jgi:DNA modification methylase
MPKTDRLESKPEQPAADANPVDVLDRAPAAGGSVECIFRDAARGLFLYRGDSLALMGRLAERFPGGCFDHVIFSVGYAMQQLGFKLLNAITWEKPNPPPNLSCRVFTHSTETLLWAAPSEDSRHVFNYSAMKAVTGKQMKTVWRPADFPAGDGADEDLWTLAPPGRGEKSEGRHPTQKPVALVERCLLASTRAGALVFDPFMGGGTTAVACRRTGRRFVGAEFDEAHAALAVRRLTVESSSLV